MSKEIFGHNRLNPSVPKSNQSHVVIFQLFFVDSKYNIFADSIDSSTMISKFPEVLNFEPVISQTRLLHL